MKIAMFGFRAIGQGSGGVEKAVEEISTRLALRGHDVTLFCRTRYNKKQLKQFGGVRLINVPALYTKHLEAASHSLMAALRTLSGFDLVHVHAIGPSLFSWLPRLTGQRIVATIHALDFRREKWGAPAKMALRLGARAAVTFPHRTIAVSQTIQRYIRDHLGRDAVYIPNGVTPGKKRPINQLTRFDVQKNRYILFLGRLVPEKGCHLLIRAFRELNTDHKLLIAGGESHSDNYARQLHEAAKGDARIVFTGPLYGEDKDEAFSNASLFVLPSTLEGMPIVLLEAMSYGCPVLCSHIPENMEVVQQDETTTGGPLACTFPHGPSGALREALVSSLQSNPEDRACTERAAAYVAQQFNWDRIVSETEKVYNDCGT